MSFLLLLVPHQAPVLGSADANPAHPRGYPRGALCRAQYVLCETVGKTEGKPALGRADCGGVGEAVCAVR